VILGSDEGVRVPTSHNVSVLARMLDLQTVCGLISEAGIHSAAQLKRLADVGDGRWKQMVFLAMIQGHRPSDLCRAALDQLSSIDEDTARFLSQMAQHDGLASKMLRKAAGRFPSLLETISKDGVLSNVIADLTADNPAVIAHGLYILRKHVNALDGCTGEEMSLVGQLLSGLLIHEDTYIRFDFIGSSHCSVGLCI
jgi:hypothetical protein